MSAAGLDLPAPVREEFSTAARLVYATLQRAGVALTYGEVRDQTGLSDYQTRKVLHDLADAGLVSTHTHPLDGRVTKYLANSAEGPV